MDVSVSDALLVMFGESREREANLAPGPCCMQGPCVSGAWVLAIALICSQIGQSRVFSLALFSGDSALCSLIQLIFAHFELPLFPGGKFFALGCQVGQCPAPAENKAREKT